MDDGGTGFGPFDGQPQLRGHGGSLASTLEGQGGALDRNGICGGHEGLHLPSGGKRMESTAGNGYRLNRCVAV
ncbi:hypothetical protein GCM10023214_43860 [Amycolatopsis dongchuanensis]|uniref:Uncharacterized protein n=1 Tax=Amycolatopsis dongchuanensis TaxID=1070866 RepID=A0ABP9QW81_9PSEU